MYIKDLIEKLILEEIEGFNRGNNIKIPKTIRDLEDDIYNSDSGEINEKFANKDYERAAYELSVDLELMAEKYPIETLEGYQTLLLFIHNNRSLNLEDPIRYLAKRSLVKNYLETNKNLINSIYDRAGNEVGDAFANTILKRYDEAIKDLETLEWGMKDPEERKSRRDDIYDLIDWIKSGDRPEEGE